MKLFEELKHAVPGLSPAERQQLYELLREPVELAPGISSTPGVCGGDACLGQHRLPVWQLEESRRNGSSDEQLLAAHPFLRAEDLVRAWDYVSANRSEIERSLRENHEGFGGN